MGIRDYIRRKEFELEMAKSKHPELRENVSNARKNISRIQKRVIKDVADKRTKRSMKKYKPLLSFMR